MFRRNGWVSGPAQDRTVSARISLVVPRWLAGSFPKTISGTSKPNAPTGLKHDCSVLEMRHASLGQLPGCWTCACWAMSRDGMFTTNPGMTQQRGSGCLMRTDVQSQSALFTSAAKLCTTWNPSLSLSAVDEIGQVGLEGKTCATKVQKPISACCWTS